MNALGRLLYERCIGLARLLNTLLLLALTLTVLLNHGPAALAESDDDLPRHHLRTVDEDNWPDPRDLISDGVVRVDITDRPAGDYVVSIAVTSEGIVISRSGVKPVHAPAPLWPDDPDKDAPDLDPGGRLVRDALDAGSNLVVLSRPATTLPDGDSWSGQCAAWRTTYLDLVASGESFVECETVSPGEVERCWIAVPSLAPAAQPEPVSELTIKHDLLVLDE